MSLDRKSDLTPLVIPEETKTARPELLASIKDLNKSGLAWQLYTHRDQLQEILRFNFDQFIKIIEDLKEPAKKAIGLVQDIGQSISDAFIEDPKDEKNLNTAWGKFNQKVNECKATAVTIEQAIHSQDNKALVENFITFMKTFYDVQTKAYELRLSEKLNEVLPNSFDDIIQSIEKSMFDAFAQIKSSNKTKDSSISHFLRALSNDSLSVFSVPENPSDVELVVLRQLNEFMRQYVVMLDEFTLKLGIKEDYFTEKSFKFLQGYQFVLKSNTQKKNFEFGVFYISKENNGLKYQLKLDTGKIVKGIISETLKIPDTLSNLEPFADIIFKHAKNKEYIKLQTLNSVCEKFSQLYQSYMKKAKIACTDEVFPYGHSLNKNRAKLGEENNPKKIEEKLFEKIKPQVLDRVKAYQQDQKDDACVTRAAIIFNDLQGSSNAQVARNALGVWKMKAEKEKKDAELAFIENCIALFGKINKQKISDDVKRREKNIKSQKKIEESKYDNFTIPDSFSHLKIFSSQESREKDVSDLLSPLKNMKENISQAIESFSLPTLIQSSSQHSDVAKAIQDCLANLKDVIQNLPKSSDGITSVSKWEWIKFVWGKLDELKAIAANQSLVQDSAEVVALNALSTAIKEINLIIRRIYLMIDRIEADLYVPSGFVLNKKLHKDMPSVHELIKKLHEQIAELGFTFNIPAEKFPYLDVRIEQLKAIKISKNDEMNQALIERRINLLDNEKNNAENERLLSFSMSQKSRQDVLDKIDLEIQLCKEAQENQYCWGRADVANTQQALLFLREWMSKPGIKFKNHALKLLHTQLPEVYKDFYANHFPLIKEIYDIDVQVGDGVRGKLDVDLFNLKKPEKSKVKDLDEKYPVSVSSSCQINNAQDPVVKLINERIRALETEWSFTSAAMKKKDLLIVLKSHLNKGVGFNDALNHVMIKDNALRQNMYLLYEGRTGEMIKTIQASFQGSKEVIRRVEIEIIRLQHEIDAGFYFFSDRRTESRKVKINALEEFKNLYLAENNGSSGKDLSLTAVLKNMDKKGRVLLEAEEANLLKDAMLIEQMSFNRNFLMEGNQVIKELEYQESNKK